MAKAVLTPVQSALLAYAEREREEAFRAGQAVVQRVVNAILAELEIELPAQTNIDFERGAQGAVAALTWKDPVEATPKPELAATQGA